MGMSFARSLRVGALLLGYLFGAVHVYGQSTLNLPVNSICFGNCSTGPRDESGILATPEGNLARCVGSTYRKTNGTTDTALWKKETGACTSSGWVAIAAGGGASTSASYITKVAEAGLSNEFALGLLATGILKNITTTGVPVIATAGTDYVKPAVGTAGTLIPDADATRDVGTSSARWNDAYVSRLSVGNVTPDFGAPANIVHIRKTHTLTTGMFPLVLDFTWTPSGDASNSSSLILANATLAGTHSENDMETVYGGLTLSGTTGLTASSPWPSSGVQGEYTDTRTGGTAVDVSAVSGVVSRSGVGGATTKLSVFRAYTPIDTSGTAPTTFSGFDIDDMTWAGTTNNWGVRYASPNGDSGFKANGDLYVRGSLLAGAGDHIIAGGTTPGVSNTSANSCGTTAATIVGKDNAGEVTVGATAGTSCTITFGTAFTNAPACTTTNETTANLLRATSTTTTVILAGTMAGGDKLAYICIGY